MYFDIISKGTMVDGATIEIEHIKPKLKCTRCGELFERKPFSFECPVCKGQGEPSEVGKEFYIDTIEVEDQTAGMGLTKSDSGLQFFI